MRKPFALIFICSTINSIAQQTKAPLFKSEVTLLVDNDNFLMNLHDGYYTNGIFLKLNTASETRSNKKKIIRYEVGQKIFTTENRRITSTSEIDRPYTGYLYARYGHTIFSTKRVLKWSGEVGTIGPASGGRQVQELYHKAIHVYEYPGWETQLKTEFGLNSSISYLPLIKEFNGKAFKIVPAIQANLGTTFTSVNAGTYLCIGAFENNQNSALWDAAIAGKGSEERKRGYELFAFFYPRVIVQAYNATVQGGLFREDKGGYVSDIKRLMYEHTIGLIYSRNRLKMQLNIAFQTKEAASQKKNHHWAGIGVTHRFN